jgi:hypothetical protein
LIASAARSTSMFVVILRINQPPDKRHTYFLERVGVYQSGFYGAKTPGTTDRPRFFRLY